MTSDRRAPVVRRQNPPQKSSHDDYRAELRFDFLCSCAYCSTTEAEAQGVGFEIDHYLPRRHFPEKVTEYWNLLWSCRECNRQKGDCFPSAAQKECGIYVIRPDEEHPLDHLALEADELKGRTVTGEFNIHQLLLNRMPLRRLREVRRRLGMTEDMIAGGIRELLRLRLDRLPRQRRGFLLGLMKNLPPMHDELRSVLEEHVRQRSCSAFLDPDPGRKEQLTDRRAFLRSVGSINEDAVSGESGAARRKSSKRPKGSKQRKKRR